MDYKKLAEFEDYLWKKMSELRIAHLSFNYGMGMIGAIDFDGELAAEGTTLAFVFEEIEPKETS